MAGFAKVYVVRACSVRMADGRDVPSWYPYHVEGVMGEGVGDRKCDCGSCGKGGRHSRVGERFSWRVPHLDWAQYDFSEAADPDGVLASLGKR